MFCPYCGKQIGDNQRFCQYCGGNLTQSQQQTAAPKAPAQPNPEPNPFGSPSRTPVVNQVPQPAQPTQQPVENSFFNTAQTCTPPVSNPNPTPNPNPVYNQPQQPQSPGGYAQPQQPGYTQAQAPKKPVKDKARIEAENRRLYNEVLNRMRYYSSVKQYLDADEFFADRDA